MVAFAANSIICRFALRDGAIDPASFTSIRLASGALALLFLATVTGRRKSQRHDGDWTSAALLFAYAIFFSYAYISLDAGTGALILFGFVQVTMIATALFNGAKPRVTETIGWLLALAGLVNLLLPGQSAPSIGGTAMMALAGIAWGLYSIRGRSVTNALGSTSINFLFSLAFVGILLAVTVKDLNLSTDGVVLAVISGSITSGFGYVIWYAALNYLSEIQAALVQLSVPALAAIAGVLFLLEPSGWRLIVSTALVLGGIGIALLRRAR
jgi:drug/metabolite transporter (DMT)-like permease